MKKQVLLSIVLGLGLLFFTNSAKSQNFQIVASFGTAHNWAVPNSILYEVDYYYPYHNIVHINRERRGRNLFYNVLLERRGRFVEVFFGRQAMILDINHYYNYPLAQHICSGHCGYHRKFYKAHRVVCNHRGHGHHNGHNHIAYRSGRNYNSYAAKNGAANRNVRSNYAYDNARSGVNRNPSYRDSRSRNKVERNSDERVMDPRLNSKSRNTRTNRSRKSVSFVKSKDNERSSQGRGSRSRSSTSVSSRSRN